MTPSRSSRDCDLRRDKVNTWTKHRMSARYASDTLPTPAVGDEIRHVVSLQHVDEEPHLSIRAAGVEEGVEDDGGVEDVRTEP